MKLKFWQRKKEDHGDDVLEHVDSLHEESAAISPEQEDWVLPEGEKISPVMRLRAKWEGYDNPAEYFVLQKEIDDYRAWLKRKREILARPVEPPMPELELDNAIGRWPQERIKLYDKLFDRGIMMPGGKDYALELAKPFALDETMSCLEVGTRLGSVARVLADKFNVWVSGREADEELALAGMDRSTHAGVQKRVPIEQFDPDAPDFRKSYFNVAFSLGEFFKFGNKELLIKSLAETLREDGQLLITDYVVINDLSEEELAKWRRLEEYDLDPWTPEKYQTTLEKYKFDVRISKDETALHIKHVKQAWMTMLEDVETNGIDPDLTDFMGPEMDLWMERVKMLENKTLAFYRFFATIK